MIKVKINREKWLNSTVKIEGFRPVRKPMFKEEMSYPPAVAQVLIEKGYVYPFESSSPLEVGGKVAAIEQKESKPKETSPSSVEVEESILEVEDSLIPSEAPTTPESSEANLTNEDKMVAFFKDEPESSIVKIRWIGSDTVEKIKKVEDLTFDTLKEILSDRQFESAFQQICKSE